jgi:hypothetical protein
MSKILDFVQLFLKIGMYDDYLKEKQKSVWFMLANKTN